MRTDWQIKLLLTVIATTLIFLAGSREGLVDLVRPQSAEAQRGVPKAWGKVVGFASTIGGPAEVLFEASDGTLRRLVVKQNEVPRE